MAYIDFYNYLNEKKRVILGHYQSVKTSIGTSGTIRMCVESDVRIDQSGSELCSLFNVDNLDWTNPPNTFIGNKGYIWNNANNTLTLFIQRTKELNLNGKGSIAGTTIEPEYEFNGFVYVFALYNNNSNIGTYQALRPQNSISGGGMTLPSNGVGSISQWANTELYLLTTEVINNGNTYIAYKFSDVNVKKADSIFYGINTGTGYNTYVNAYANGCIFINKGVILYSWIKTNISMNTGNKWEQAVPSYQIKGYGQNVTQDYRTIFIPNTSYFTTQENAKPDNTDYPQYPDQPQNPDDESDTPTGGDGDGDKDSDIIPDTDIVTPYNVTGLITVYKMQQNMINQLGKELWSENFLNGILKITQNAIDAVIQLKVIYLNFPTISNKNIMLGNYKTTLLCDTVASTQTIDFGQLSINRFFGDFKDYNPWTKISIYLPFIGVKDLNVNEIMNSVIKLKYNVDVVSGDCIALITVTGTIDGTELNSVLYQFEGNMNIEIPISQASANTMISARLSQIQQISNMITRYGKISSPDGSGNPWDKAQIISNGIINTAQNEIAANHLDITRTGNIGGAKGMLSIKTPYLIIERVIPNYPTSYAKNLGVPTDRTIPFNSLTGFTQILEVFISNFTGTQNEYEELISLLQTGVVF